MNDLSWTTMQKSLASNRHTTKDSTKPWTNNHQWWEPTIIHSQTLPTTINQTPLLITNHATTVCQLCWRDKDFVTTSRSTTSTQTLETHHQQPPLSSNQASTNKPWLPTYRPSQKVHECLLKHPIHQYLMLMDWMDWMSIHHPFTIQSINIRWNFTAIG